MPTVTRPGGVEIGWREHGEGPPVALAHLGYADHVLFAGLTDELSSDHRVVSYDTRGAGQSRGPGPYDIATDVADLIAVLEDAGVSDAVVVGNGDGANRAIHAAAQRPDLCATVIVPGNLPLPGARDESEGLAGSVEVLKAMVMLLENDYRAGVHAFVANGNPGLDEAGVQRRVEMIVAHCSHEAAVGRIRSWIEDDPAAQAQALGDRLWILHHEANPWFSGAARTRLLLPDAHHEEIADGPMARPELTAEVVRQLTRTEAR